MKTTHYARNQAPEVFKPGTLMITHKSTITDKLIHVGEWLRLSKEDRKYAWATYNAMIVSGSGTIIEMNGSGSFLGNAITYNDHDYYIVDFELDEEDTAQVISIWTAILADHVRYAFMATLSLVLWVITGTTFQFAFGDKLICSGAAAVGLCASSVELPMTWRISPGFVTPAEIAQFAGITPPTS